MFNVIVHAVQIHPLDPDRYLLEKICVKLNQTVNPNNPSSDNNKAHCRFIAKLFRNYRYNYAHGTSTVYVLSTVNQKGVTYPTAVPKTDGMKLLEDSYFMAIFDAQHWHSSVNMIRDEDGVECSAATNAHVLHVASFWQTHFASSSGRTRKYSKYTYGECVTQSEVHRHDAYYADLCVSVQSRRCRTVYQHIYNDYQGRYDFPNLFVDKLYSILHTQHYS